jgi:hypothetical protein
LITLLRGLISRRKLRSEVSRAVGSGVGFYEADFPAGPGSEKNADRIIDWCRRTLASVNRPYGVDHMTLAIKLCDATGLEQAVTTLQVLRPRDFYDGEAAADIATQLAEWEIAYTVPEGRLHAVLFSWGDLTDELLPAS